MAVFRKSQVLLISLLVLLVGVSGSSIAAGQDVPEVFEFTTHEADHHLSKLAYQSQLVVDGQIHRLYSAYFLRKPDDSGFKYWRSQVLSGTHLKTVSDSFAESREFTLRYSNLDDQAFIQRVYLNVMGRPAEDKGKSYWQAQLRAGVSRGSVMMYFSESKEYVDKTQTTAPDYRDPLLATVETGSTYEQRRGADALQAISYNWRAMLRGWNIEFKPQRTGYYGLTFPASKRIVIYVRPSQSQSHLEHIVAHEMGHAVDVSTVTYSGRQEWREARNLSDNVPWWPGAGANDRSSGAGDFAESFAAWQLNTAYFQSHVAPFPSQSQLTLLSELAYG